MKKMRRIALLVVPLVALCACHHETLEDKAQKIADDYTERYCPTPEQDMTITDSITFDRAALTFNYYYTLTDRADDAKAISMVSGKIRSTMLQQLKDNTSMKVFKDAAYRFHYIYRSKKTGDVLFETYFTQKDYK